MLELLHANIANFNQLNNKVVTLENKHAAAIERIEELEINLNDLQKQHIKNKVEIRGIPREEKEDLQTMMSTLYANLKLAPVTDMIQVYRKGKKHSLFVIDFKTLSDKEVLLKAAKTFNKENQDFKLNSSHLGYNGNKQPVYISESLTPMSRKILGMARALVKEGHYKYCWTSRGNVLIRKKDGESALILRSCAQLDALRST